MLVPWSAFWERNYFVGTFPALQHVLRNNFVRGGVSGLGVVNLLTGFRDLGDLLLARRLVNTIEPSDPSSISAS